MIKITEEWLVAHRACQPGLDWFRAQGETDGFRLLDIAIASRDYAALRYANWCICRVFTREQRIRYAIFAARQVLPIFEAKYPDDKRPRQSIEASEKYLNDPTDENAAAAYAYAAAYAASDAAVAAAAAYAADYAAANAADAGVVMMIQILEYGRLLLSCNKSKVEVK